MLKQLEYKIKVECKWYLVYKKEVSINYCRNW